MTSAYILVAAILLLGGLIAALGDRLGTKVGKARLRLYGLRPRQTAIVVTIVTGTLIAASTLGILFTLSKSLRQGIFKLDDILAQRRAIRQELGEVTQEKERVKGELVAAEQEQAEVEERLAETNNNFLVAQRQMGSISKQATTLRSEVKKLLQERKQLKQEQQQLAVEITSLKAQTKQLNSQIVSLEGQTEQLNSQVASLEGQTKQLNSEIGSLQQEVEERDLELRSRDSIIATREDKINQQNQTIAQREQNIADQDKILSEQKKRLGALEERQQLLQVEISDRDETILNLDEAIATLDNQLKEREANLEYLENQITELKEDIAVLELFYQNFQVLRQGNLALERGEVLTFSLVRIEEQIRINETIDFLLQKANEIALQKTRTGNVNSQEQIVRITTDEITQLIEKIKDGEEYIVQIRSGGNYVQGENRVRVFADVTPNKLIFYRDQVIASFFISTNEMTEEKMQQNLQSLLSRVDFRARSQGMIGAIQLGKNYFSTLISFFQALEQSEEDIEEIQAVALDSAYSVGPLKLALVAIRDDKVLFSTAQLEDPTNMEQSETNN